MDAYSGGTRLPEVDSEEVARFVAIANCPADQAHFFLQATDGNFDRALTLYFGAYLPRISGTGQAAATPRRTSTCCSSWRPTACGTVKHYTAEHTLSLCE